MASKAMLLLSLMLLSWAAVSLATSTSEQLQWCKQQCHQQQQGQQQQQRRHQDPRQCEQRCEQQFGHGQQGSRGGSSQWKGGLNQQVDTNNPYFYDRDNFITRVRNEHGHYKVLEPFTQRSSLLRGIEEYRFAVLKANPQTFIVPHHTDAEGVFIVLRGSGSITVLHEDNSETHQIRLGDIYRVPAGATVYLVNSDTSEKLHVAKIFRTISTPGEFKEFIGAGGQNPESFYPSFSNTVLEAALNRPFDEIERLFGQQQRGAIMQASEQQIQALTAGSKSIFSESGPWPFSAKSAGRPYNLLRQRPAHANMYGQLYEATQHDYEGLTESDIDVSVANISAGAMLLPNYNTKATKLAYIVRGFGYGEIVCPHVAEQLMQQQQWGGQQQWSGQQQQQTAQGWEQQGQEWSQGGGRGQSQSSSRSRQWQGSQSQGQTQSDIHYQKVGSVVSKGDIIVVPAGHPVALVNTGDDNLVVVCFGLKARNNKHHFLAGRNNILRQMTDEAKVLSWGVDDPNFVDQVLDAQPDMVFASAPGPSGVRGGRQGQGQGGAQGWTQGQRQGGGQQYVSSILEAAAGI